MMRSQPQISTRAGAVRADRSVRQARANRSAGAAVPRRAGTKRIMALSNLRGVKQ